MCEAGSVSYYFFAGQRAGGVELGFPHAMRLASGVWMREQRTLKSAGCACLRTISARSRKGNDLNNYGAFGWDRTKGEMKHIPITVVPVFYRLKSLLDCKGHRFSSTILPFRSARS
jgi:hypothetical protein